MPIESRFLTREQTGSVAYALKLLRMAGRVDEKRLQERAE
jgi:hypothetical protein